MRKYFSIIGLAAVAVVASVILSGCGTKPASAPTPETKAEPTQVPAGLRVENNQPVTADEVGALADDLDTTMAQVDASGLEQADLADKDLGL